MNQNNVILTGLPRSGTTLACHLLNELENTVALHEPMKVAEFRKLRKPNRLCDHVHGFFEQTRQSISTHGTAPSKHVDGIVPDNHIGGEFSDSGLRIRRPLLAKGQIRIEKDLASDFLLVVKHPSAFTAVLDHLVDRFPCYAIIRNPLSVLASWNSVPMSVRDGHAPAAERLDGRLAGALKRTDDRIERQLLLLNWFYEIYRSVLPQECVLRYEEIISTGGGALSEINPQALGLKKTLQSKNKNPLYDQETMRSLGERLLETGGAYTHFYPPHSVEELLAA